ncbi:DNA-directed RNA polymerase 1B, mitochondrial isoform X1 [Physcomitrium patens]|uniref:DNA-directed RNA polymerase n=1 Tax=Physcomitrium patens TaxID=3218 RepID=A9TJW1_PHYPA|nr:DNA-directed RNA polymerase 1B, mitochondrial-like [Physcomitrium patens]PNR43403.1 hypothetical protein PHYPA_015783 [Physcomitrium patens]|eukprot:XP_024391337.1 DNA-directed RNA polymerase 1B, mitochondrial-like [Physcomitrella patens]
MPAEVCWTKGILSTTACIFPEHVKQVLLTGYPVAGMWRSAAQQLARQKLHGVRSGRIASNFPLLRQVTTSQSTAHQASASVQSLDRASESDRSSEFKSGLRFLKPSTSSSPSSLTPLDSAFIELVDLLPKCWQSTSTTDFNHDHSKLQTPLQVFDSRAYSSALEEDELCDEDIIGKENEHAREALPNGSNWDTGLDADSLLEQKSRKRKARELHKRQVKIETEAWQQAATEYRELMTEMCRKSLAPNLPFAQSLLLSWFEPLRDGILEEQRAYGNREHREHRSMYGPYMCQLPADMLAVITMHRLMGLLMCDQEHGCVKVIHAAVVIGEAVEQEVRIFQLMNSQKKSKDAEGNTNSLGDVANNEELEATRKADLKSKKVVRDKVKKLVKQNKLRRVDSILKHASTDEPWSTVIHVKLGSRLLELMLETSFVRAPACQDGDDFGELRPAFQHKFKNHVLRQNVNRIYGVIECDQLVLAEIDQSVKHMVMPYMPMLVKPLPWKGFNEGGYLYLKSSIMRTQGAKEQRMAVIDTPRKHMKVVVEALNVLGETGWRVNKRVLEVVEKLWKAGGGIADLVEADDVPIPERPDTSDKEVWHKWKVAVSQAKRTNSERHSLRCDTELKLGVANKLIDEEAFYYPHNLDFRGRAYPMHPHLNHLGNDLCRGLLIFADGKPLGPSGLRWIKIQLANLYGGSVGKMSFDDRAAFAEDRMEEILDSAERPLDGSRLWLKAEDPFQFLAACIDLRDALASGNPETFVSHLPVHQDGSCNGLQHYAALGRDRIGAESVNLIAGDKPADVYSGIAERVKIIMEKDALKNPLTSRNAASARLLQGQIDRKLVKQTVMTSVYGVTFIGARMQILNRLKERSPIAVDPVDTYRAACYAAKVTLDALGEMFKEARCIMSWLGDCAKIIAAAGHTVRWTSPLGLPIVQPYRKHSRHLVKTSLQVLALRNTDDNHPVLASRQRSAFPPNFVHSLDSSHMMMTALACSKAGLTFAGVHDSYWTHAGDVENMNVILRKNFVKLYKQPILENLLLDFQTQFPDLVFPEVPARGDLDLKEVLKSPYFFN